MPRNRFLVALWVSAVLFSLVGAAGCGRKTSDERRVRVGFFPNLTHAQALVGLADGSFQKKLGGGIEIKPFVFNAGPAAIEAIFAGEIDVATLGPNPAINGAVKSKGEALRIVAGATSGGAVLVVRPGAAIQSASDFAGKKAATPQLGNTQDVAFRHYLLENKLSTREKGGTVQIVPMQNADILTSFLKGEVDAAWVPEPWGARLVREAGGRIFLDERQQWPDGKFVTACVVFSARFLRERPDLAKKWLAAHVEITDWIRANPDEAKRAVNGQIERYAGKKLSDQVLGEAWSRLEFTWDPLPSTLLRSADQAFALGFLGQSRPDLSGIFDLALLNEVLKEKGRPAIHAENSK